MVLVSYKTASGNRCCNKDKTFNEEDIESGVTKPQAVIAVATVLSILLFVKLRVTKPQAVIAVATENLAAFIYMPQMLQNRKR